MRTGIKLTRRYIILLALLISGAAHAATLPSFEKVKADHRSSYASLLDRNGEILQTLQLDHSAQRLPWVQLRDLSPAMQDALLVSEDRRFYQHEGVDWRALASAAWENLAHNTHRGASTLTMQLAGLLDPSLTRHAGGRTYIQKWQQIRAARQLEKRWSKAQILEAYLNLVDFRSSLYGIHAASLALFNKTPATINPAEASILAALLRGPNAKPAIIAERACGVAALMHPPHPACADITALALQQAQPHPKVEFAVAIAPEAARQLLHVPGQRVVSSLDMQMQNIVISNLLKPRLPATLAAAVILDNNTGEILAYANAGNGTDNVLTPHPAGSLLQAFIYELALEQKRLTAATLLDNIPTPLVSSGVYPDYMTSLPAHDWVSVRTALSKTLTAPAVRTLSMLPATDYADRLHRLGLNPESGLNNLLGIANAYQSIAATGLYQPASFHVAGLDKAQRIMPVKATAIIRDILTRPNTQPDATNIDSGNYSALVSNAEYAVGFTANYTIALWLKDANPAITTELWQHITDETVRLHPSRAPELPNGLVIRNVSFLPPVEPARPELFLPGTEQTLSQPPSARRNEPFSQPAVSSASLNF